MAKNAQSMAPDLDRDMREASLRAICRQFPSIDVALSQMARRSAELTLPSGTVHVISDVHGDDVKLRHVVNNASGTLRPLVEQLFANRLSPVELQAFLTLIFYPREELERVGQSLPDANAHRTYCHQMLSSLFEIVRQLAAHHTVEDVAGLAPEQYRALLLEMVYGQHPTGQPSTYFDALVDALVRYEEAFKLIHLTVRLLRNLAVDELVLAGDCWDRGARGDRVVETIRRLPRMSFVWGNHDAAWLGACLGHEALVAHVLRISLRYRRLSQLEEGYGITLQPLEHLVREKYAEDPATCYATRGAGLRDSLLMARMHKAAALMQFKLEGQLIERNPQFELDHRRLLHRIDQQAGTVEIDGQQYSLADTRFPTIDPAKPYELCEEEQACMERIKASFLASEKLWEQMLYLIDHGSMCLKRGHHLIFHGCVPVDERGEFLSFEVDGKPYAGRPLFEKLDEVIARVPSAPTQQDCDLLWYLWCGPRSPLFGKDRITTFENDLVPDKKTHVETKNPYFELIHTAAFCDRILAEFDVDPANGLIVNGHVPVKIDDGEDPLKRSGKAITIDGAFSSAYGDHGYTLVIEPRGTFLAKHHHFESVEAALRDGIDIIPTWTKIRDWNPPLTVADTERGAALRSDIALLEQLVEAYRQHRIRPA